MLYEGNSTGLENQLRQGFSEDKFHDLFRNSLDYEIIIDNKEYTYKVFDFGKEDPNALAILYLSQLKKNPMDYCW